MNRAKRIKRTQARKYVCQTYCQSDSHQACNVTSISAMYVYVIVFLVDTSGLHHRHHAENVYYGLSFTFASFSAVAPLIDDLVRSLSAYLYLSI